MIPARVVCWVVGHAFLRVHIRERQDGWVIREHTAYRCSRCGRTGITIERPR